MLNGFLGGFKLDFHVGEWVSGGGPAHEWVLPALAVVELHLPVVDVVGAALHGVLGGLVDADAAGSDVLLGDAVDWSEVHLLGDHYG